MIDQLPRLTQRQLVAWRAMEAEHSGSRHVQERIVRQHIKEFGMGYYPALQKMEAHLKKR